MASGNRSISTPQRRRASSSTYAFAIGAYAVGGDAGGACEGGGAQEAAAEAGAFFVGPIDEADRDRRTAVEFGVDAAEDFEGGEDVQGAVQPAAVWDGIQVAADEQGLFGLTGEGCPVVAGGILMFDREAASFCANHSRAFSQVSVHATRWAPFASAVRARSSFSSAIVRLGSRVMLGWSWTRVAKELAGSMMSGFGWLWVNLKFESLRTWGTAVLCPYNAR